MLVEAKPAEQVAERVDVPAATEERRGRKDAIQSENAGRSARTEGSRADTARAERPAKPQRDDRQDRPRRDDKRHRRDDDVNDGTVGFGDDMPAFMRIAAKV